MAQQQESLERKVNLASTAKTATCFTSEGNPLSHELLRTIVPGAEVYGQPGETGVVVLKDDPSSEKKELAVAARHGDWVPLQYNSEGKVDFGGMHTDLHVEHLLGREIPGQAIAHDVLKAVREGKVAPYQALTQGIESEAWHHDMVGALQPVELPDQLELQQGLLENPRPLQKDTPNTPQAVMYDRSQHMLQRSGPKGKYRKSLVLDTGVPLVGNWTDPGISINAGEYSDYVHAAATKLEKVLGTHDRYATELADRMAGGSYARKTKAIGHMGTWLVAAAHVSVGLPHVQTKTGEIAVPLDIAIAQADLYNSQFSAIAELLMAGAPLMLGQKAVVRGDDGREHWVRDARTVFRHTLATSFAGAFIRTPEEYRKRVIKQITSGQANTADRAAYIAKVNGQDRAVMHGPLRVRLAGGKPAVLDSVKDPEHLNRKTWVGRIEYTGRSSSPSLLDEAASNAMLYLITLAAYEAVEAGKHPVDYFAKKYPSMAKWEKRQELVRDYSMYGPEDKDVSSLIRESLSFLHDMADKYSNSEAVQQMVSLATARVANLMVPDNETPRTLEEYVYNPHGSISIVMQHMYEDLERLGYPPEKIALRVAQAVHEYQLKMAQQFVDYKGDGAAVLGLKESTSRR